MNTEERIAKLERELKSAFARIKELQAEVEKLKRSRKPLDVRGTIYPIYTEE